MVNGITLFSLIFHLKCKPYFLTRPYVRSEWGNTAGEITPEQVTAVRKELAARAEPWAEADLLAVPTGAPVGPATPTAPQESGTATPAAAPTKK